MSAEQPGPRPPFLTAVWKNLLMRNHEVPEDLLRPLLPPGTELDPWNGRHLVSLVGFQFLETRVMGIGIPLHRNFEEVNLRFYVRRKSPQGWRRGVCFVRELVPRRAISTVARVLYEEPYLAVPMSHRIVESGGLPREVAYTWRMATGEGSLAAKTVGPWLPLEPGGEAEFITEHYWGYTKRSRGPASEYQVEHPPWRVMEVTESSFAGDVTALYGKGFVEPLAAPPVSALLAEGSAVTMRRGTRLRDG